MSVPEYAMPLITEVWRECDPVASTSGRYYRPEFGVPPKTLHIYEAADADWERAHCKREAVRGWLFDGSTFAQLSPVAYPDYSRIPKGMYWHTGMIEFCVDVEHRRAVYDYVLGPRYARGYKRTFASGEAIRLEPDGRFLLWLS
jgi:hypothetical protein